MARNVCKMRGDAGSFNPYSGGASSTWKRTLHLKLNRAIPLPRNLVTGWAEAMAGIESLGPFIRRNDHELHLAGTTLECPCQQRHHERIGGSGAA